MVLLANYDTSIRNNRVLGTNNSETGELEARYVATDVGATLGKVGKKYDFNDGLFGGPSAQKKFVFEFYEQRRVTLDRE